MTSDASRIRVLIATTLGPVEVENLEELPADLGLSVACIAGTNETAGISQLYRSFVAKGTGVIAERYGHESFRIDVSSQIDEGKSWQLGVFIVHAAHHAHRLARKPDEAGVVVLAPGQVNRGQSVVSVGFLPEKIAAALQRLKAEAAAGRRLIVAWPKGNESHVDAEVRAMLVALGADMLEVDSVQPVLATLGLVVQAATAKQSFRAQSPFRGLEVFGEEHREFFFGRGRAREEALYR